MHDTVCGMLAERQMARQSKARGLPPWNCTGNQARKHFSVPRHEPVDQHPAMFRAPGASSGCGSSEHSISSSGTGFEHCPEALSTLDEQNQ